MTEKDMHQHNGANICGKCYDLIYRPRVRPSARIIVTIIPLIFLSAFY